MWLLTSPHIRQRICGPLVMRGGVVGFRSAVIFKHLVGDNCCVLWQALLLLYERVNASSGGGRVSLSTFQISELCCHVLQRNQRGIKLTRY